MFDAVQDQFHQFLATTTTSRPNTTTTLPPPSTPIIPNSHPFPLSNPFPFPIHHHHHHASSTTIPTSNTPYPINFHDHHPNFPPAVLHEHQTMLLPPSGASHFLHQQPPPLPLHLHHHHHRQKFGGEKQAIDLSGGASRGSGGLFSATASIALQEKERTMISMRPATETVVVVEDPSWSSEEVLALLRIRSSMENWFPNLTWEHVSRKLGEHGFKRSAEKCKEKFEEESRYFNNMNSTTTFAAAAAANTNTTTSINCNKSSNYNRLFGALEVEDLYHHQQQDHHHHHVILNPHHHDHRVSNQTSPDDHHNQALAAPDHDDHINTYNQDDSKEEDQDIEVDEVQVVVEDEEEDKIGQQISVEAANSDKMEDHHHHRQSVIDDINHQQDCSTASHDHHYDDMITEKTTRPSTSSSSTFTRKRKRDHHHHQHHQNSKIKFEMFKGFCEKIMNQMISQQEELHNKILEDMLKRDEEKIAREEAWMKHEMERINQEIQVRAQEQAVAGDRQAKIIEFLNKFSTSSSSSGPAEKGNTMIDTTTSTTPHDHQHHGKGDILMKVPNPAATTITTMSTEASTLIDKDPSTAPTPSTIPTSSSTLMAQINPSSLTTQHSSSNNNMPTSPSTTDEISKIPMSSCTIHHDQPNAQNPNTMISTQVPKIHQPPPPSTSANSSQHKSQQIVSYNPNNSTSGDHQDSTGKRWPRDEVLTLINIRCSLYNNVVSGPNDASADHPDHNNSKAPLWERISQKMLELGYKRSAKRCKEKWENINKYFRKTKDSNKKRSVDSRTCPYFHQLKHLYNQGTLLTGSADNNRGSANPTLEFSESAGTGGGAGEGDHGNGSSTLDADSGGGGQTASGNLKF